jgi:hypothetical protein
MSFTNTCQFVLEITNLFKKESSFKVDQAVCMKKTERKKVDAKKFQKNGYLYS